MCLTPYKLNIVSISRPLKQLHFPNIPPIQTRTMASKRIIKTDKAPSGLKGIYSQAVVANGMVYCAGSVAMDPKTNKIIDGDVKAHTVG